ncbi:MAG: PQQ-binding-like beta-propeller repeat protein, partial [Planctomycetota bacterium]
NGLTVSNGNDKPLWPAPRPRRFPQYFLLGIGVVWLIVQLLPITRDYKVVAGQVSFGVGLTGMLIWLAAFRGPRRKQRRRVVAGVVAFALLIVLAVRFQTDGDGRLVGWRWRWTPLPDQTLALPEKADTARESEAGQGEPVDSETSAIATATYPAFLGGRPWAEVPNVRLATDWQANPPVELWRRPIGAGWSAFAVADGLAITQEQRDEQELVVAYRLDDGEVAWWHGDTARFDPFGPTQRMGGVGPRATPTIFQGRVYTHGATGIVNCLELASGELVWSVDTQAKFDAPNLMWGKSGSPLVLPESGLVIIGVGTDGGSDPLTGASLVALDRETGEVRWQGGGRVTAYATPTLGELAGRRQILQVNQQFLTAHDASTGEVLWEYPWRGNSSADASCSQPIPLPDDRVFLSKGYGVGSVLLDVSQIGSGAYAAEPIWQKRIMKTKFGNVVIRDGYIFGLDGILLQCVDLATGRSVWKERRQPSFGHGQLMLVGDHLLVLTEWGELVLATASSEGYEELASLRVFDEDQITWNNPALAGDYLLVRNAQQAACYRMPLVASPDGAGPLTENTDAAP